MVEEEWAAEKALPGAIPCHALDELMGMAGLTAAKRQALGLYRAVKNIPPACTASHLYNMILTGNPGTGKMTVARLFGQMLFQLGLRPTDRVYETSGAELLSRGVSSFLADVLPKAKDGILVINDAAKLSPMTNREGAIIVDELLIYTALHSHMVAVFLEGHKEDIQKELFSYNICVSRRFPIEIVFEDYKEKELISMFLSLVEQDKWHLASREVAVVACRRLARGAGFKGFTNAHGVRSVFEAARSRADSRLKRWVAEGRALETAEMMTLVMEDVLGARPDPDQSAALQRLEAMVGLKKVKQSMRDLITAAAKNYDALLKGERVEDIPLHRLFLGNPGTGKTTVARIYASILKELDLLSKGEVIIRHSSDLVGSLVGDTEFLVQKSLQDSSGNVLVIDEVHALGVKWGNFEYTINTLVASLTFRPGDDLAVVLIGQEDTMRTMISTMNPGIRRRFELTNAFIFSDFETDELRQLLEMVANERGYTISEEGVDAAMRELVRQQSMSNFMNIGAVNNIIGLAIARFQERMGATDTIARSLAKEDFIADALSPDLINEVMAGLENIEPIWKELETLRLMVQRYRRDGMDTKRLLKNYVFMGNPGTGKTTVARRMAEVMYQLELLPSNKFIETNAVDLQGQFVGETKLKVDHVMLSARGGVLLIDEAYGINPRVGGQFAGEALSSLLTYMSSPDFRDSTVVILAGYRDEMEEMMAANPGLARRFGGVIDFCEWGADNVCKFITNMAGKEQPPAIVQAEALEALNFYVDELKKRENWSSAGDSMQIYREMLQLKTTRSSGPSAVYTRAIVEDVLEPWLTNRRLIPTLEGALVSTSAFDSARYLLDTAAPSEPFDHSAIVQLKFPLQRVGKGSFGDVYACTLAESSTAKLPYALKYRLKPYFTGRRAVCVKLLQGLGDADERADVLFDYARELQAHSLIQHPRIVPFLGAIPPQIHPIVGETCGIVVQHVDDSLWGYLKESRREEDLPMEKRWQMAIQLGGDVAEGLQVLHEHPMRIVHRDLHEENVLILAGRALIADFGKGKALGKYGTRGHTSGPGMILIIPPEADDDDDDDGEGDHACGGGISTYDCSYDTYGLGILLAKMALWASLPQKDWWKIQKRIARGPCIDKNFSTFRARKQERLIQEWKEWLLLETKTLCEQARQEIYFDLTSLCMDEQPSRRPQARHVAERLRAIGKS